MIPYVSIKTFNPAGVYAEFDFSDDDLEILRRMFEDGEELEALDIFVDDFQVSPAMRYQEMMSEYLRGSEAGPMRDKDQDNVTRNIALLSIALSGLLISNFNKYLKSLDSERMFLEAGLTDKEIRSSIEKETVSEFDTLIGGVVSRTQGFVVNSIRTLQREFIAENLLLQNSGLVGEGLEKELIRFRESLRIKYPEIYSALEKGNMMTTSSFANGIEQNRHYKLDYYMDLATRTSLLNVDRNVNMVAALVNEEEVVEFYLADPRDVKKDREICQEILADKINGLSILALNEDAAKRYGIMSVDEAKSTPDYSFGPMCRHSLRRCSKEYLRGLDNGN